jgi:adenylate cyclase
MADIFVSYAAEDRDRIRPLVERLEREGWSVWWDRALTAGRRFDEKIEQELNAARCVLVAWSNHSISSRWCRTEANEGLERNVLVPLCIDDVRPPLAFRSSHTPSLTGWPEQEGELAVVLSGVRDCLGVAAPSRGERDPETKSIAVLPFTNLSSDPDQSFLADGIAEQIISLLSKHPRLRVVSRSSSFWFKGRDADIPTVVSKLRVTHVLEGSVMRAGPKLRITAQLIDGPSDDHLWAGTYDRELDDVFAIQDDIAASVAAQLKVTLQQASAKRPKNTDAHLLVLQARHLLSEGESDNLSRVESILDKALRLDPDYVPALNELARSHFQKRQSGLEAMEASAQQSRELFRRALTIDPENAIATLGLAYSALEIDGDLATALHLVRRAIELDSTELRVLHPSAPFMLYAGRIDDAIAIGEHVVRRDPLSIIPINNLGQAYLHAGRFDDAEAQYESALVLLPGNYALGGLCKLELLRGNAQRARAFAEQIRNPMLRAPFLAASLFDSGRLREAEETLAELRSRWPKVPIAAFFLADVYACRGDSDNAFAWLARAVERRQEVSMWLYDVLTDPIWEPHHADPRWHAFLEKTGQLPEQLATSYFELRLPE